MSKQYNKAIKRQRRLAHVKRKKATANKKPAATGARSAKEQAPA